jgi:hypothetical protein
MYTKDADNLQQMRLKVALIDERPNVASATWNAIAINLYFPFRKAINSKTII